jgi:hypothetical protein
MVGNFSCNTCQEPCLTYYDMMIHNFQAHLKATDSIPINYNGLSTCEDEDGKIRTRQALTCAKSVPSRSKGPWFVLITKGDIILGAE